jgi:hypothetical protein
MSTIAANSDTVETLCERIAAFVSERQRLRAIAADRETLEQNRLEIAHLQQRLSVALIRRYLRA